MAVTATRLETFTADAVAITGGTIDGTPIGSFTPAAGLFTTIGASGTTTPTGGIVQASNFAVVPMAHSGGIGATSATMGTDTAPSITETYVVMVYVPVNGSFTGISILNGSAIAGNLTIAMANSGGQLITSVPSTVSASTAASGTAAFQAIPFVGPHALVGPAYYFILLQCDSTSYRFRTHVVGAFPAGKLTGTTYGSMPSNFAVPSTFTANLGPVCSLY